MFAKVMRIADDNTLEDIEGVVLCLQFDVEKEVPQFPIAPRFRELIARIEDKLSRNKNRVRRNWFEIARDHALAAETAFLERRARDSSDSLRRCWEYLEQGNKAHRRKATFVASVDGHVIPANSREGGKPDGPVSGSQPIRSETNRTSSAAGSRR